MHLHINRLACNLEDVVAVVELALEDARDHSAPRRVIVDLLMYLQGPFHLERGKLVRLTKERAEKLVDNAGRYMRKHNLLDPPKDHGIWRLRK